MEGWRGNTKEAERSGSLGGEVVKRGSLDILKRR
jgi:hypothetical protein